jgi:hypothetical protein
MHRTSAAHHVDHLYVEPDPDIGRPGTQLDAVDMNSIQEELANAVEGGGLTLDPGNDAQLAAVIAAERTARSDADDALDGRLDALEGSSPQDIVAAGQVATTGAVAAGAFGIASAEPISTGYWKVHLSSAAPANAITWAFPAVTAALILSTVVDGGDRTVLDVFCRDTANAPSDIGGFRVFVMRGAA